ncbi:MAG: hypothetical protein L0229_27340 [Blastocatellia bacterium]|nr:hypothetical protein [Blastocatellia bacterium]
MSQVPGNGHVQIHIDGLIVGRFLRERDKASAGEREKNVCEMGVLPAEGHALTICYELMDAEGEIRATKVDIPQSGRRWTLEIEGSVPDARPFFSGEELDRLNPPLNDPNSALAKDFGWVLNVESDEFPEHEGHLSLKDNMLTPIIQINNGTFYNSRFSKLLERAVGDGEPEPFGSASDEISIELDPVPEKQEIVLKDTETGKCIFRIPVKDDEDTAIFIKNVPTDPPRDNVFHFHMYYSVLGVPDERRYDFVVKPDDPAPGTGDSEGDHSPDHPGDHEDHSHDDSQESEEDDTSVNETTSGCGGRFGGSGAPLCGVVYVKGSTSRLR